MFDLSIIMIIISPILPFYHCIFLSFHRSRLRDRSRPLALPLLLSFVINSTLAPKHATAKTPFTHPHTYLASTPSLQVEPLDAHKYFWVYKLMIFFVSTRPHPSSLRMPMHMHM